MARLARAIFVLSGGPVRAGVRPRRHVRSNAHHSLHPAYSRRRGTDPAVPTARDGRGRRIGSADWSDLRSSGVHRLAHQARLAPGDECRAVPAGLREPLRHQPTTAVMAGRGDRIVFGEGPVARPTLVRAVRKSLLVMLYGQPVQDGRIALDATLDELGSDDVGGLLPAPPRGDHLHRGCRDRSNAWRARSRRVVRCIHSGR